VAAGGNRPVVLVVDDEPAIRLLCKVNLELDGYEVVEAATLAEARQALSEAGPALVLLDMHIGNERGNALLEELGGHEPPIPVAVVTGSTELDEAERTAASAVLGKPFTIDDLLETVRSLAGDTARR
jgi:DNA-binding NtrC family response regulator